jgi:hypothetical protein
VGQLVGKGMPKVRRDCFELLPAITWYISFISAAGAEAESVDEQRRALLYEQTVKTRLENDTNRKRLIPAEVVAAVHNQFASDLTTEMEGLAARCAGQVAGISDIGDCKAILSTEHRGILARFASNIVDKSTKHIAAAIDEQDTTDS